MSGVARAILDLVFPPRCLACRALGAFLCPACHQGIRRLPEPFCPRCAQLVDPALPCCRCKAPSIEFVVAAGAFDGPLRAAIHSFKYNGQRAGAHVLATLMAPALDDLLEPDHLLVPVPLHPRRQRQRGYNQSTLLARALAAGRSEAPAERALRRIKLTTPQVGLTLEERAHNMEGAFVADPAYCARRTLILIDDVCTTGATLRAAAQAARDAGARRVYAAVLAAAQPGRDR